MRLLELKITNFGVFQCLNSFDLEPTLGPIVLFGGKNGSGKTTVLESIRLCLYGIRALPNKASKKEYDELIARKLHRQKNDGEAINHASITLRFEYAQFGNRNEYEVTRYWTIKKKTVAEKLTVKKDNVYLKEMAEDRWQDFIDDLIPPGISGLFFFDGEKIQSLATDENNDQILGEEIKSLLGLNVIEKLQTDLDIYLYKQRKDSALAELSVNVDNAAHYRDLVETEYKAAKQDFSQTEASISFIKGQIEKTEKHISIESSGFATERNSIQENLLQTDALIQQTERSIHELSTGLLPFALVPNLLGELKKQILAESKYQQWASSQSIVRPRISHMRGRIESLDFWNIDDKSISDAAKTKISLELVKLLEGVLATPRSIVKIKIRHQLSDPDRIKLLGWIDTAIGDVPYQIKYLVEQLEKAELVRQELQSSLNRIPEDSVIKPIMEELNQHYQRLGELKSISEQQEKKLTTLSSRRLDAKKQLQKVYTELRTGENLEDRLTLVNKVHGVLGKFLIDLTTEKIFELEKLIVSRFNELIRKPDLVKNVAIDPESFTISLRNTEETIISKESLSAGEKQMFAIAVLWALRQLSGRPFPVVIDTPLGRLDSEHRNNLVEDYFPRVSHQVIILSTDTEVDEKYFELLEPYISHSYHLVYDSSKGATKIQSGYFWGN